MLLQAVWIVPGIGQPGRVSGTHEIVMNEFPYILVYQVTSKDIRILVVMHTARKWPQNFKRSR